VADVLPAILAWPQRVVLKRDEVEVTSSKPVSPVAMSCPFCSNADVETASAEAWRCTPGRLSAQGLGRRCAVGYKLARPGPAGRRHPTFGGTEEGTMVDEQCAVWIGASNNSAGGPWGRQPWAGRAVAAWMGCRLVVGPQSVLPVRGEPLLVPVHRRTRIVVRWGSAASGICMPACRPVLR
jgi:hypothetical protein